MRVMISLPMYGRTQGSIDEQYNAAAQRLTTWGHEVADTRHLDTLVTRSEAFEGGVKKYALLCLGESLEVMSTCDAVYFCKGWQSAHGCQIEYMAAKMYGLNILMEEKLDEAKP